VLLTTVEPFAGRRSGSWCRHVFAAECDTPQCLCTQRRAAYLPWLTTLWQQVHDHGRQVWVYGMVGSSFELGAPLSAAVQRALPALVNCVEQDVRRELGLQVLADHDAVSSL